MSGHVIHVEIPADDTDTARAFWGGLFGWQLDPAPGPPGYFMARTADDQGAAVSGMEPGRLGVRVYFDVDDLTSSAKLVTDLGGYAGDAMSVPNMGSFVICRDPQGNEFGLWQATSDA